MSLRLNFPGYLDGSNGLRNDVPWDELPQRMLQFWKAGIPVHCHANGDEAIDASLDALATRVADEKGKGLIGASRNLVTRIQVETRDLISDLRDPAETAGDLLGPLARSPARPCVRGWRVGGGSGGAPR